MPLVPAVGTEVGTVEGCSAVFQVAVVGQAVVATVGDVVAYGLGPGTGRLQSVSFSKRLTRLDAY